ncbi:polysaccharide lyase [Qipengyuania sp. GH29]|nr:heparin lyase I family protein [Qipengyuania sphaerica]MBX7540816.1 polysaccharide lyase [Qipengyuania sphaerica]
MDDEVIRFTVAPGEQWARDANRGSNAERAEMSAHEKIRFGERTSVSFAMRIASMDNSPGRRHSLLFQLHGPNRTEMKGIEGFAPPPFDMRVRNGKIHFVVRSGSLERGEDKDRIIASIPVEYSRWQDFRFDINLGDESSGQVKIWRDGTRIADYSGPVGYEVGKGAHYWKFGIYQYGQRTAPSVVDFGRVNVNGKGSLLQHERDVARR